MRLPASFALLAVILTSGFCRPASAQDADLSAEQVEFFEKSIRPLLAGHCLECHGPDKQQAELRLDTSVHALRGNESGAGIVPGQPGESRLIQVIRYSDDDVQMPPEGKLDAESIGMLTQWIADGAFWPAAPPADESAHESIPRRPDGSIDFELAASEHWAYRPVEQPVVPDVEHDAACHSPIDRFVAARLEQTGLTFSPESDRRTLIRRATMDLLGISPTYAEIEAFVADESPDAYARLVDRLLDSPSYGERWARHWLDLARYADTKGYVFTENRFYPFSYTYRDYVITAFNNDKPYDQFLMEQLAADQLGFDESDPSLAALGFLTIGPRYRNNQHDIIDDRLDVTFRGLMGMTVACARCHDHKYDPIPTADYYSVYGVFASSFEPDQLPVIGEIDESPAYLAYRAELENRQSAVEEYKRQSYHELLDQARARAGDLLLALLISEERLPEGIEPEYEHGTPRDKLVALWRSILSRRANVEDPVFGPWTLLGGFSPDNFNTQVEQWLADRESRTPQANPLLIASFRESPPESMDDVARVYGLELTRVHESWKQFQSDPDNDSSTALPDENAEQLRRVLYGANSVTDVPFEQAEQRIFERDNRDRIRELNRKVSEWEVTSEGAPPRAMVMYDREQPQEPVVFVRGDSGRRGDRVPRRFPQVLKVVNSQPFHEGSGRRELASAITSHDNPLTARVFVNRVWRHHFGSGLVATPSDFGSRSSPPTHPELLDYLAATFIEQGWSMKDLHRRIMLSTVYRQESQDRPECRAVDPENGLLWRANRQRLDFESMRDGMLFAAGRLDMRMGGRPVDIETQPFTMRRTVYALIDRNNFSGLLRTFDLPTPDSSAPARPDTTVPQQALFALNAPFTQEMSATIAAGIRADSGDPVQAAFRIVLARDPQPEEHQLGSEYLDGRPESLTELVHSLLMSNEFMFVD